MTNKQTLEFTEKFGITYEGIEKLYGQLYGWSDYEERRPSEQLTGLKLARKFNV